MKARETVTARLKENFMHQLLAVQTVGGRQLKALKEAAVQGGACEDFFDISDAVNELIREGKVRIQFIAGNDPYLWLVRKNRQ